MKKETHQGLRLDGAGRDGKWKCRLSVMSLCFFLSPRGHQPPFFLPGCLSFSDIIAFLSVLVPFSLSPSLSLSHTLTYKQRELSLAYRDPLRLWSKAFIWWLGLKNGHLLLPLIDRVSVLCGALFIQSAVCLLLFGKTTQTDSHTRSCILCLCLCVKRTESKMRKMRRHTHRRSRSIDINIINGLFGLLPPVNYTQTGYSI